MPRPSIISRHQKTKRTVQLTQAELQAIVEVSRHTKYLKVEIERVEVLPSRKMRRNVEQVGLRNLLSKIKGRKNPAAKTTSSENTAVQQLENENMEQNRARFLKSLDDLRADYIASGKPLLGWEDISNEVARRRGEIE
jgi:DNA-binding XRE family transcriptional regulator